MFRSRQNRASSGKCPCNGDTLNKLIQPAILTVLKQNDTHGYNIVRRIAQMPLLKGDKPDATGVYRWLKIMERRGLVVSSWELSDSGPAKRLYTLTPAGRRCLVSWISTLGDYRRAIGKLIAAARKALAET